jgi:hypothetical protein
MDQSSVGSLQVVMARLQASLDASSIVVGQPLPFSVYSADRKLLLTKGRVVESERTREQLLRAGRFQSESSALELAPADDFRDEPLVEPPFERYIKEFHNVAGQSRIGVRLSREDSGEGYPCWVVGADETHGLVVTAPAKPDRSLVLVSEGQIWVFRLLYLTAVCKFSAVVRKVHFEPMPLLHVSLPKQSEMRHIRSSPRVSVCLRGSIHVGKDIPVLITDVSTGGLGLAVERANLDMKVGQRMTISFCITMLGIDYNFKVPAITASVRHELDKRYPELVFAGVKIEAQSETEKLVLNSYVYERAATDFNSLWQVLLANKS